MVTRYKLVTRQGPVGIGVMDSQFVAVSGVAKCASVQHPYAIANEFICGQLGRALGLPIPPGFIIEDNGVPWHVSLDFNLAGQQLPPADPAALASTKPDLAAGIVVFDSWIVNADRHAGNLAFDQSTQLINLFDHSHAFFASQNGRMNLENFSNQALLPYNCVTPYVSDIAAIRRWLARVGAIPRYQIEDAVRASVDLGLPSSDAHYCVEYLADRAARLPALIAQQQHALVMIAPDLWT